MAYENNSKIVNVAVSLFKLNDPYMTSVKQSLERIENENKNKVKFTFFDGKNNQLKQSQSISAMLNDNYDLLLINLVDAKTSLMEDLINKAKQTNQPIILFNVAPKTIPPSIRNYGKAVVISTIDRTKYSISTINNARIKTKELALRISDWDEELAKVNYFN